MKTKSKINIVFKSGSKTIDARKFDHFHLDIGMGKERMYAQLKSLFKKEKDDKKRYDLKPGKYTLEIEIKE